MSFAFSEKLRGHAFEAAMCHYANHVLQTIIKALPTKASQFTIDELCGQVLRVARHSYWSRVLERLIERCLHEQVAPVAKEMLPDVPQLFTCRYGNFVIQKCLCTAAQGSRSGWPVSYAATQTPS